MSPHLLLHPVLNEREAPCLVTDCKVVHPAPENRIDEFYHPFHRLAGGVPEDVSNLRQQHCPLLEERRVLRTPDTAKTPDASEVKTQKTKALL